MDATNSFAILTTTIPGRADAHPVFPRYGEALRWYQEGTCSRGRGRPGLRVGRGKSTPSTQPSKRRIRNSTEPDLPKGISPSARNRRTVSGCGDSASACWHRWPCAESRAPYSRCSAPGGVISVCLLLAVVSPAATETWQSRSGLGRVHRWRRPRGRPRSWSPTWPVNRL